MVTLLTCATVSVALVACGGGGSGITSPATSTQFKVGTTTSDVNLPSEPTLPADTQVCATLQASNNLVKRPDGALPPEADPSVVGIGGLPIPVPPATLPTWPIETNVYTSPVFKVNPDQARIQAALDACGVQADAAVGAAISTADATAATAQATAAGVAVGTASYKVSGASAEELKKPQYKAPQYAVRLVVNSTGLGNGFISGPLVLPSGVTLWIDTGVTLFASRDVMAYSLDPASVLTNPLSKSASSNYNKAGAYCANVAVSAIKAGSSSNCAALITGNNLVNSAVVGDGAIDGRGYAELVTSNPKYPLMKVDLTCSNTYVNYAAGTVAADGTACDNGGTVVDSKSSARNMSFWDLAWLGNMVDNGTTGVGGQSNPRMMVFSNAKNLTLYHITLNNSSNFHVVPSGVDGFVVWGVKVQTPSLAAFANPAGNGNPLYTGETFNKDNVKNTDAFDPGGASAARKSLSTSSTTTSATGAIAFDGYLKNFFFVYNYVSTGDDDVALKGSSDPSPNLGIATIDGSRGVFSTLPYGVVIAHNHFYWGHGVSVGSETNAGIKNVQVYDNSFDGGEEGLRIKSDWARGGEVSNVTYTNICMRNMTNSLLFTPYYSTKALSAAPLVPNFHDISLNNVYILGASAVKLMGFQATTYNGVSYGQNPLVMTLSNVVTDSPSSTTMISSDANLTLNGLVNLPIVSSTASRIGVTGTATNTTNGISSVVDCSQAFVDFPSPTSPFGSTWLP
ncbi:MAG: glycosyl hydrolase family 28 protein [Formivibrio sp.]|nr:glycosyl hydrolase family 28 protein [Formivibrio sp.]